jgi:LmbE family N-acetylglucosaminyl deacetylase
VIVVTDGDAYCEACQIWKNGSIHGPTCTAAELSDLATPEVDSFAEVRRGESAAAAAQLGRPAPEFLGYPDTGIAAAWGALGEGRPETALRRSDFAGCASCETCGKGYGAGPASGLTAATLRATLAARIAAVPPRTLVATTHPLDGHGDHAGLGSLVEAIDRELEAPRPLAFAVIHAHTPKDTRHPDCWYPAPRAVDCGCIDERCAAADPGWIAALAAHRLRPEWPAALPDDADYGAERQLCLPERLYRGEGGDQPAKLAAVRAYASQRGALARDGAMPAGRAGILDCSGYLDGFVRRTEAFVLADPAATFQPE